MPAHPGFPYRHRTPSTRDTDRVTVAFLARVSTDDQQDPTLSLPRQLANCEAALPAGWEITAWFWDIESGRMALERRGRGHAHEHMAIAVPRDGSLIDLLAEAVRPGRRFDAVICESIDRLARRTYIGTKIEHDLEQAGVRLYAADEPIDPRGKRSTGLLTRRVKQGVAEWYVTDLLERAWDGYKIHTGQGWNIGKPLYGYLADKVDHPVPAKAADGLTKTRLIPDPDRAPTVTLIFELRAVHRHSYKSIAAILNADPALHPPPDPPNPHQRRGSWCAGSVREILHNPKYTGYMVWNRKASKQGGRPNPPSAWVWSDEPTHEPLVDQDTFEAAAAIGRDRRGSRVRAGANSHPATKRSYPLRSYVRCGLCDYRMWGKSRHGNSYYTCYPAQNSRDKLGRYPADHPKSVYVREDVLMPAVDRIIATHVFGPDRRTLVRDGLAHQPATRHRTETTRRDAIQRKINDISARMDRLITELESTDPTDHGFRDRLRRRYDALDREHAAYTAQLDQVEAPTETTPEPELDLLDAVPLLENLHITEAPEHVQRALYDALQLQIHYDRPDHARFRIVLTDDTIHAVVGATVNALTRQNDADVNRTRPRTSRHRRGPLLPISTGPAER